MQGSRDQRVLLRKDSILLLVICSASLRMPHPKHANSVGNLLLTISHETPQEKEIVLHGVVALILSSPRDFRSQKRELLCSNIKLLTFVGNIN